jgi:hypothetical protein
MPEHLSKAESNNVLMCWFASVLFFTFDLIKTNQCVGLSQWDEGAFRH